MTKWRSENRRGERERERVYSTLDEVFDRKAVSVIWNIFVSLTRPDFPTLVSSSRKRILSVDFAHKTLLWPRVSSFDA